MEILPVTSQFNVGFSGEKGKFDFLLREVVREAGFLTGRQVLLCGARTAGSLPRPLLAAVLIPLHNHTLQCNRGGVDLIEEAESRY